MAYYVRKRYFEGLLSHLTNTFIIRNPEETLLSHFKKFSRFTFEQAGYTALQEMHEFVTQKLKQPSIIVDGNDFRRHPESIMRQYCLAVDIGFDPRTLHWQPGNLRGWEIWQHQGWHKEAERSSGVIPPSEQPPDLSILPRRVRNMLPECRRIYEELFKIRIRPESDPFFEAKKESVA